MSSFLLEKNGKTFFTLHERALRRHKKSTKSERPSRKKLPKKRKKKRTRESKAEALTGPKKEYDVGT